MTCVILPVFSQKTVMRALPSLVASVIHSEKMFELSSIFFFWMDETKEWIFLLFLLLYPNTRS